MRRDQAFALLPGTSGSSGDDEIKAAYAKAVKADHPDMGGAGTNIASLQAARDLLLSGFLTTEFPCISCKGSGYVKAKMAKRLCDSCNGTGERRGH